MINLDKLQEEINSDIRIYIGGYTDLHSDDVFALTTDITQIVSDKIEDMRHHEQ